jgi:two-component sensor histidine kinase
MGGPGADREKDAVTEAARTLLAVAPPAVAVQDAAGLSAQVRRLLRALRWGSVLVPLALIGLFGAASWERLIAAAEDEAARKAQLVREYAQRTIEGHDILLSAAEQAHRQAADGPEGALRLHRFLAELSRRANADRGIGLVAPDGDFIHSSATFPAQGNVGAREYLERARPYALFIDRLRLRPSEVDALVIARRSADEGPEAGIWVSGVLVETIDTFLRGIASENGDAASIIRGDGKLLVRNFPMPEPVILAPDTPGMRSIIDGDGAPYTTTAVSDGVRRIYVTRRVGALPIFANYGVALGSLRAAWARQMLFVGGLVGAIGAIGYGVVLYAGRALTSEAARSALDFDRKLLEEAQKTAGVRETMLHELNHRIKNNLQMVQSLIRLQKSREGGPDLDAIAARVGAIAGIHDLLYRAGDAFGIDLAALLSDVARNPALAPPERNVRVECALEPVEVDASLATPIALCAVELITNAVKHAYGPEGGVIRLGLTRDGARAALTVEDDGGGLPEAPTRRSGRRVIEALVAQVQGTLTEEPGPGARIRIDFPLAAPSA